MEVPAMLNLVCRLLRLDKNEAKVEALKDKTRVEMQKVVAVLRKNGKLQEVLIEKTTTFYLAQAMGVLK